MISSLRQDNPTAKVVIFSQWDALLVKVDKILLQNKIRNVFCKGNVTVKKNALELFKNPTSDVRVIILSSKKRVSGYNLTIATSRLYALGCGERRATLLAAVFSANAA